MSATPLFADRSLAARLESLCVQEMERFVETAIRFDPGCGARVLHVAGGVAAYVGQGSSVNQAFGMGMDGPVSRADIVAVEEFYASRGAAPLMGVCPLSHPSLTAVLATRGWAAAGFEQVMYRALDPRFPLTPPAADGIEIREAVSDEDRATWLLAAAIGFSAPQEPDAQQLMLGEIVVRRPGSRLLLAFIDGCVAGTGELFVTDEIAWLSGDATLPQFRRRGVQTSLQGHRLRLALREGCTVAVSEAVPGGPSQRNMERAGFRVAYTRVDMVRAS